jgi:type II secretory ATPase GspE/PulE/Tfp pilus assembly ATPase PilB-like protein
LAHALKEGFVPMVEDGIGKVLAGITDLKELMRVVDMTDRMN